jgi:hypothetical protein
LTHGPLCWSYSFQLLAKEDLLIFGQIDFYERINAARVQITIRNTRASAHPGGTWDLGSEGSVDIKSFELSFPIPADRTVKFSPERNIPLSTMKGTLQIHQESSGGENWNCINHWNRNHQVPFRQNGYQVQCVDK